jgi:hypothetical protein
MGAPAWTPGPWVREEDEEYSLILFGSDGVCLLEGHAVGPFKPELREANARLIAAAPELYDLLFEIEDTHGNWLNGDLGKRVRAALAKARGEQEPSK